MGEDTPGPRYKWAVFVTVALGTYLSLLDNGIVSVSLPTLSTHFGADLSTIQWVVLTYFLVVGALLMPLGRAADIFGRKRVFIAGFAVYIVGAALAASAQNVTWLLCARGVQAVGAAAIQANATAINISVFPPEERGKALGMHATVVALGAVSGPAFGGLFIDALGWRSAFLMSIAVGAVGLPVSYLVLKERFITRGMSRGGRTDWQGMVTSAVALVAALLVLSRGHDVGWTSLFTMVMAAVAVTAMAAFVTIELRSPSPMIDLRLFQRRLFALGTSAGFLVFTAIMANALIMPFYIQGILGFSARTAGLLVMPQAATLAISGPLFGRLSDRIGSRWPTTIGLILVIASFLALRRLDSDSHVIEAIIPMMVSGFGMGMFQPANNSSVLSAVEPERYGVVAAFLNLTRNTGQVVGIAVATLIITVAITNLGVDADIGALRDPAKGASPLLIQGFVDGMRNAYLVSAGVVAIAVVCSFARGPRAAASVEGRAGPRGVEAAGEEDQR